MILTHDDRAKYGSYSVSSATGLVHIDIDGPPKHCVVTVREGGKSIKKLVRDYDMADVWSALGVYSPLALEHGGLEVPG